MIGLLALFLTSATAYNNGMGKVPALGWSSWYASPFGSEVTESFVKANAQAIKAAGLLQAGFSFINVDEGWLKGRYAENGTIFEDFEKFPSGMRGLGDWLKAEGFSYGLYSCRGTCQCGTGKYSGPGSHGFEREDVDWMVEAGSTWLKIDSCCGSQDHGTAFSDYAKFRDAMNATGVPVYFNLCGWAPWYSPPDPALNYSGGISLGNSWRIWGDGGSWGMIVGAINTMAQLADYNQPFGFNDPDNILGPHGTVGTVSESQARAQMVLWSLFPTQLIIGEDMTQASAEYIATVGNSELIAINQDWPFVGPARRIVGSDLKFPCNPPPLDALYAVQALPCEASPAPSLQDWLVDTAQSTVELLGGSGGYLTLGPAGCASSGNDGSAVFVSSQGSGAACAAQQWVHQPSNGSFVGPFGKCLDEYSALPPAQPPSPHPPISPPFSSPPRTLNAYSRYLNERPTLPPNKQCGRQRLWTCGPASLGLRTCTGTGPTPPAW
jgi:alpha-galactosidase